MKASFNYSVCINSILVQSEAGGTAESVVNRVLRVYRNMKINKHTSNPACCLDVVVMELADHVSVTVQINRNICDIVWSCFLA